MEPSDVHFEQFLDQYNKILSFIAKFGSAKDCFLNGCCYWFAHILTARFNVWDDIDVSIVYDQIEGHFASRFCFTEIGIVRYFDVTGDITDLRDIELWTPMLTIYIKDPTYFSRIARDCINFDTIAE